MRLRCLVALILQAALVATVPSGLAAGPSPEGAPNLIKADELRQWLTYFSSDELEGRSTYSEGLGLAAAFIASQLKSWGVRPAGTNGSYLQRVDVKGVKSTNRSTLVVEANGQTRTFKVGEEISLPPNVGSSRTFTSEQIEFLGYGLDAPGADYSDYRGKDVKGKVAVFIGTNAPKGIDTQYRRLMFGRARYATEQQGAIASIGPTMGFGTRRPPAAAQPDAEGGFGSMGPRIEPADFTTVQRLDTPLPPNVGAKDEFLEFLFGGQETPYPALKAKAAAQEPLPRFTLKNVRITFNLDAEYKVVRTQFTHNVVGIVEGKDPQLKKTYVAIGAHYDHVGYAEGEVVQTSFGPRRAEPKGRVKESAVEDRIWNGADDDGSGSMAMLAIAKAFALGPKPRRSILLVWHTGEERGLYGSRYFADYPSVPLESIVAQINMDMIGRERDDKSSEADSVYLIGSDRISTELHNLSVEANARMPKPLKLDFELNDPGDPEQFYFRSDHYSYAAKGIPVVFLTTGLEPDYHFNTDSADKIDYPKMTRITQLVYAIALRVGNLEHAPERDNRGPRAGKGSTGKLTE